MQTRSVLLLPLSLSAVLDLSACQRSGSALPIVPPAGFPSPKVPADNPLTREKIELGRYLFYDKRLSANQTYSCGTCHRQEFAFTDGRALAVGSTGEPTPRSVMSLSGAAYASVLTWSNPNIRTLEQQAMNPLFGDHPVELGMGGKEDVLLSRLRGDSRYPAMFSASFPGQADAISVGNVVRAIASFERSLISGRSPYDRYQHGEESALSESASRGLTLFFGERAECYHCHGTFLFSDAMISDRSAADETAFHNNGLFNVGQNNLYPPNNQGLFEFTRKPTDMGSFRAPSLRNIEKTAPYMHDGSIATLEEVIEHYARGGRKITTGPYAGDGATNIYKSNFIQGFDLTLGDKEDLLAFLRSLTDEEFLKNPQLADPFAAPH